MSEESSLPIGSVVRIMSTPNVASRVPRVIGRRGVILKVPIHPNTWYQVQVGDEVLTFQGTALRPLTEKEKETQEEDEVMAGDDQIDFSAWPAWPDENDREASDFSLQEANREDWIGRPVMIVKGRGRGSLARVLSTASGWVQIRQAPADGSDPMLSDNPIDLSKRACDLNVLKDYVANNDLVGSQQGEGGGQQDEIGSIPPNEGGDDVDLDGVNGGNFEELAVDDTVAVIDGQFEGKIGKVTQINQNTYTLSIKNVSSAVLKRRSQLQKLSDESEGGDKRASTRLSRRGGVSNGSSLDLVGKRVQILNTNQTGVVIRSGHGFYSVSLDEEFGSGEVMKRKEEILVIDGSEEGGGEENEGGDIDEKSNNKKNSPPKVSARARNRNTRFLQEDEIGVTRKRPSRGGGGGGGGGAATRRNVNKRQKEIPPEQHSQTKLEAARRQRQELIVHFLSRSRERLEKTMGMISRPNLQEWLEEIQGRDDEDREEEEDEYTPLLYDPPFCSTCFLEKEFETDYCWNPACWECPVHDPSAIPLKESALPVSGRNRLSALLQSPRKPGFVDYAAIHQPLQIISFQKKEDGEYEEEESVKNPERLFASRFTAGKKRAEQEMIFSPLVTYSLRAPSAWVGVDIKQTAASTSTGYFGSGWKDGLIFDEPSLPGEQANKDELALDFRWKRGLIL